MDSEYKPLPEPFVFDVFNPEKNSEEVSASPLVGTPDGLTALSSDLRKYGKAFMSRKRKDLPTIRLPKKIEEPKGTTAFTNQGSMKECAKEDPSAEQDESPKKQAKVEASTSTLTEASKKDDTKQDQKAETQCTTQSQQSKKSSIERPITIPADHQKPLSWKKWSSSIKFGLEMQEPWAELLLQGTKTIETRAYDLPKALIGKKIEILQSKRGKDGVSALSDVVFGEEKINNAIKRVGWCIFDKVIVYRYKAKFEADEEKHLVKRDSQYGWKKDGSTKVVYGWNVSKFGMYTNKKVKSSVKEPKCLIRRMRSIYEIR